jgi:hypothetical protein
MDLNQPVVAVFAVAGTAMLAIGAFWFVSADDDAAPGSLSESTAAALGGPILMATGAFFLVMLLVMWLYVRGRQSRAANGVPAMARLIRHAIPRLELELDIHQEGGGLQPYRLRSGTRRRDAASRATRTNDPLGPVPAVVDELEQRRPGSAGRVWSSAAATLVGAPPGRAR